MKIIANNVSKVFDDAGQKIQVLSKVNFEVNSGNSLAIVGRSGVGKTTLLYIIGGLDTPSSGEVIIGDTQISSLKGRDLSNFRGKNIGFVFQFHQLLPEFSALENVALPLMIQGISKNDAEENAVEILKKVGLENRLLQRPGTLSGGEQQRVAIARAIVTKPGVILADEPTGSLDPYNGEKVFELLQELHVQEKTTLIIITHSSELASKVNNVIELSVSSG